MLSPTCIVLLSLVLPLLYVLPWNIFDRGWVKQWRENIQWTSDPARGEVRLRPWIHAPRRWILIKPNWWCLVQVIPERDMRHRLARNRTWRPAVAHALFFTPASIRPTNFVVKVSFVRHIYHASYTRVFVRMSPFASTAGARDHSIRCLALSCFAEYVNGN